jgi:hypothetical protein
MREQRQCAWCLRVMDGFGAYSVQPGEKIRAATHGICPRCKDELRAEIEGTPALAAVAA